MAQQTQNVQTRPSKFVEVSWESIQEPGCYVDALAGDLYRVPQEALLNGSSPIIRKVSAGPSRFIQLSGDPTLTTFQARMLAADLDIKPNF